MNILIIPSWYKNNKNKISGSFFFEQAMALKEAGNNVYVLNISLLKKEDWFGNDACKLRVKDDNGLIEYTIRFPSFIFGRNTRTKYMLEKLCATIAFKKLLKDNIKIDIIHAHSIFCGGIIAEYLNKKYNIPYIITEHSTKFYDKLTDYETKKVKMIAQQKNILTAVSDNFSKRIKDEYKIKKNIYTLNNMFNFNNEQDKKNMKEDNNEFTFLSCGNLIKRKNFDILIKAFHIFQKENKNSKLKIIGLGEEENKLKKLADELNILNKIEFLGKVERKNMFNEFRKADCFILLSKTETFGVVYIEALSTGIPIIASKTDGGIEIVNERNGLLVNIDDINDTVEKMNYMYKNYFKFDKEEIKEACKVKYSKESYINNVMKYYNLVIGENK